MKRGFVVLVFLLLSACSPIVSEKQDGVLNVVVSFYPLEEFVRAVGGDRVSVFSLVRPGVEPHEWEPSPSDIARISNADVLVFNGAGLEGWMSKVVNAKRDNAVVIVASDGLDLLRKSEGNALIVDPHIWLDPVLAQGMVSNIVGAFVSVDSAGAEFYRFNGESYVSRLKVLDEKFKRGFSDCARREFVVSHDAFGYLARRYSLVQLPVGGVSSEVEPTPGHIVELLKFMKSKNINVFFVEPLINPRVALALARDVGARVEVLNPFEGLSADEIARGLNYFGVMEQNLNKLVSALGCVR